MTARPLVRQALAVLALVAAVTAPAAAQKGSKGSKGSQASAKPATKPVARSVARSSGNGSAKAKAASPGKAKSRVTHTEAVDVSRRVLLEHGYTVARVERRGDTQVIYYYRGNNGRGKGRGPLERIVVRPSRDIFVFEGAPADVKRAVTLRLQF